MASSSLLTTRFLRFRMRADPPINQLPSELLLEIFVFCLPAEDPHPSPKNAPQLLCRVCSLWRNLCINEPRLWASIHYPATEDKNYMLCSDAKIKAFSSNILPLWLERAKALPLSLDVHFPLTHPYLSLQFHPLLHAYSSQFVHLTLALPAERDTDHLQAAARNDPIQFERLESLKLIMPLSIGRLHQVVLLPDGSPSTLVLQTPFTAIQAPLLRKVNLVMHRTASVNVDLAWKQITHLVHDVRCEQLAVRWHKFLVEKCPALEVGTFSVCFPDMIVPVDPSPLTHFRLTELTLCISRYWHVLRALHNLHLPRLRKLTFIRGRMGLPMNSEGEPILPRHRWNVAWPRLEEFVLEEMQCEKVALENCLEHMDTLMSLDVRTAIQVEGALTTSVNLATSANLISLLAASPPSALLPVLKRVEILAEEPSGFDNVVKAVCRRTGVPYSSVITQDVQPPHLKPASVGHSRTKSLSAKLDRMLSKLAIGESSGSKSTSLVPRNSSATMQQLPLALPHDIPEFRVAITMVGPTFDLEKLAPSWFIERFMEVK